MSVTHGISWFRGNVLLTNGIPTPLGRAASPMSLFVSCTSLLPLILHRTTPISVASTELPVQSTLAAPC